MIVENPEDNFSHAVLVTGSRSFTDEAAMITAFNDQWRRWGVRSVTRPLLVSGHCPQGADALAEQLWSSRSFDVMAMPADWSTHGRAAGLVRNQQMVNAALTLQNAGISVVCLAFLDLCSRSGCRQAQDEQLMPTSAGHYSHGTVHCRAQALAAGLEVHDMFAATTTAMGKG